MSPGTPRWLALVVAAVLPLGGCVAGGPDEQGSLSVFAASSLTEAFDSVRVTFERRYPDTRVIFSFGSSAHLAGQLRQGAQADVFATANHRTMALVTKAGLAPVNPPTFARNRLQIAVPAGNPGRVRHLADLARPELTVALCAEPVPCGTATQAALRQAGLKIQADTYEKDVKAALAKVMLGEVDAALVYRTDIRSATGRVVGIELPTAARVVNDYPVVVLNAATNRDTAEAFVGYLRSPAGRRALTQVGFDIP